MKPSRRLQDVLLAVLAVIAIGASAYAIWSVNRPHPSVTGAGDAPSVVTDGAAQTTTAESSPGTSATATAAPSDDAATGTAADGAAGTASADDGSASVQGWVTAWQDDADLMVVGDGYSHLTSQWVQQWATLVAQDRPVQIRHWGETEDRSFNAPIVLSEGEGPALRVWSASRGGTTIAQAAELFERFDRASADPAAILVSLGMDSAGEDIPTAMDDLLSALDDVPVLVAIAPEGLYEPGVAEDLLAWAQANADRVAVVDLRESGLVEPTAEEWAQAFMLATQT